MRGKDIQQRISQPEYGITPAYAGKSWIPITQFFNVQDHPRLCGEKGVSFAYAEAFAGITPAYAGKRFRPEKALNCVEDHPRLCGEKLSFPLPIVRVIGSPPPMRGKENGVVVVCCYAGITPAYAGKSGNGCQDSGAVQDHPRLCGEKPVGKLFSGKKTGSPPPMRGKVVLPILGAMLVRITPAYAGKSPVVVGYKNIGRDHPRLCGEKG